MTTGAGAAPAPRPVYPRRKDRPRYAPSPRCQELAALRTRLKVALHDQAQLERTGPIPLRRGMELIRLITIRLDAAEMAWLLEVHGTEPRLRR